MPTPRLWSFALLLIAFFSAQAQEGKPVSLLSDLPEEAQTRISAVLGRDHSTYSARQDGSSIRITNPGQHLTAKFDEHGVTLQDGRANWAFSIEFVGYGTSVQHLPSVTPRAHQNRVEYRRGNLLEWYVNGPAGLEQGFTLDRPSTHPKDQPISVVMSLSGDLAATLDDSKTRLRLNNPQKLVDLQYGSLTAYDAVGKQLPAWLELQGNNLSLNVSDDGAQYPVVIDPTIKQFKLLNSNPSNGDDLGYASAISGNTIVVGSPGAYVDTVECGAAFVFVKPSSGWANMTESAKLVPSDCADGDEFGSSVAISGNNIAVGAPDHPSSTRVGKGYYYTKPPVTGWSGTLTEFASLGNGSVNGAVYGTSVAISGQDVLVGSPGENTAYLLVCATNVGSCGLDAKFYGVTASSAFGTAVAVNGFNFVVTDPWATVGTNQFQGAAYAFSYLGHNTWSRATLTSSDGGFLDEMGASVAMTNNTIVVGCPYCGLGHVLTAGAAYVYTKPATGNWVDATQTAKLTSSDGVQGDELGFSVAVSGNIIVAGAPLKNIGNNATQGEAYVYISSGAWSDRTESIRLIASDGQRFDSFGQSVGISGAVGIVGANFGKNGNLNLVTGSEYLFMQ